MNNFSDFRAAFLHSKFWTHNSLLVPDTAVILNEDFVDFRNIIRVPEQVEHFRVHWFNKRISGEICIPGQWNYAYVDGKFYHLVKMHSNGFIKGVGDEWFYYNLIYDDWQNDWLNNTFYLKGTLELTGDPKLAMEYVHQMSPILENVNDFRFLNGIKKTDESDYRTKLILPKEIPEAMRLRGISSADIQGINQELKNFHEKGKLKPEEDRLWIPFMYKCDEGGNGKWSILQQIKRHEEAGFRVYDVTVESAVDQGQAQNFRNKLEIMLGSQELYLASSEENRVFSFAKAKNPTKGISEINLSGCTDITILDRLELKKRYSVERPMPTFTIRGFVDKICNKQGWPSDYKDEMISMFEEVVIPKLAPILSFNERENKVFRDVGIEKIERDVITRDHLGNNNVKNPEGLSGIESPLISEKRHKNHIGDNIGAAKDDFNPIACVIGMYAPVRNRNIPAFKVHLLLGSSILSNDPASIREFPAIEDGAVCYPYKISPSISLVYLPYRFKLTSTDDEHGFLDFSRKLTDHHKGILLLPDYDRKTHVLGGRYPFDKSYTEYATQYSNTAGFLKYDPKDPQAIERTRFKSNGQSSSLAIYPIIFSEIEKIKDEEITLDWEKPSSEILKKYLELGKDNIHPEGASNNEKRDKQTTYRAMGALMLKRGYTFMALNGNLNKLSTAYYLRHKMGKSACGNKNYCDFDEGDSNDSYIKYVATESPATRPIAQGIKNPKKDDDYYGREFQTEMSFPLKTDYFAILDILEEFKDIPDAFLRGEAVNSNQKKGRIIKYLRTYWHTNKNTPGAYRYGSDQEKLVPKNTVIMIWICTRCHETNPSNGDSDETTEDKLRRIDHNIIEEYNNKNPGKRIFSEIGKLLYKLCKCFFLTPGEVGSESGAIPDDIKNETKLNNAPKNKKRQSQLSIAGLKPHHGFGYCAGTKFYAPLITDEFRFTSAGYQNFDLQGSNDGFMSLVPNMAGAADAYLPRFTFRDKVTNITYNNYLAFLINHYVDLDYNIPNEGVDPSGLYKVIKGRNNNVSGWDNAVKLHNQFGKYLYNGNTLTLQQFIFGQKKYKSKRTDNPEKFPNQGRFLSAPNENKGEINSSAFDQEVPPFAIEFLDPDSKECVLGHWDRNSSITGKSDRLALYRDKLEDLVRNTLLSLENWNTWIKFEGTNGWASIKLNSKGYLKGDYELFTNEITTFKHKETEKWTFVNHKEDDVDVIINTRNELNIYGNKFPLKSRKISDEDELDIGLHVKALDDIKQTQAAVWYSVTMNLNEQDILQTYIETPKELVKYTGFSDYEREKLIREIGLRGQEYLYNKQMIEYQKEENKFTNQYEKDWIYKEGKYEVARGATQIIGGVLDVATGGMGVASAVGNMAYEQLVPRAASPSEMYYTTRSGIPPGAGAGVSDGMMGPGHWGGTMTSTEPFAPPTVYNSSHYSKRRFHDGNYRKHNLHQGYLASRAGARAAGGAMGIVGGALTIAEAYETFNIKDEYRKQKYAMAEKKLSAEGDILNKRHEFERQNLVNDLMAMSANVVYPQLNANIVYKLYNKDKGINDVHIVQYFPSGRLLEYIKNYYKEFGYNILVRNYECTGIANIVNQIRYQYIYEINYPNICIQEMIRARALMGVKVIPWKQ